MAQQIQSVYTLIALHWYKNTLNTNPSSSIPWTPAWPPPFSCAAALHTLLSLSSLPTPSDPHPPLEPRVSRRPPPPPEPSLVCSLSLSPPPQIPQCPCTARAAAHRRLPHAGTGASARLWAGVDSAASAWRRPVVAAMRGGRIRRRPPHPQGLAHRWICVNLHLLPRVLHPTSPAAPRFSVQDPRPASSSPSSHRHLHSSQSSPLSASRRFRADPNPLPLSCFLICS